MKFLTLAGWTGVGETEQFARTYKGHGLATVRYSVLEVTATVEPFGNGRGFLVRVLRAQAATAEATVKREHSECDKARNAVAAEDEAWHGAYPVFRCEIIR